MLGDRFLTARAGLIIGPYDPIYRLGWWLDRIARGGRVVVPDALDQPIAVVDARDLAGWLVEMAERGESGGVNATGPAGMTTYGGLLDLCREVTGSDAEWVPVPEAELLDAGVQPWVHLPLWLPAEDAATALGRRHDPRPGTRAAQPPAARLGRRHLGLAAGVGASGRATGPRAARPPPGGGGPVARGPVRDLRPTVSRGRSRRPPTCW